jgi:site-specific DNA-methyltransferase (adenine-specific)
MDNVEGMKMLDDNSIDLTVTSPPYDNLRDYKKNYELNYLGETTMRTQKTARRLKKLFFLVSS